MSEPTDKKVHQGRNIKRFREMLGLKQEAFAAELGEDWTQRRVSLLEGKEDIEPERWPTTLVDNTPKHNS